MSSPVEGQQQQPPKEELTEKELAKLEKKRAKEEAKRQKEEAKAARLAEEKRRLEGPDVPYSELVTGDQKFGHTFIQSQVKSLGRKFTKVTHLDATMKDQKVWIRARCQNTRKQGGKLSFVTLRQGLGTVQVVVFGGDIAKFAGNLSKESVVDLYGTVTVPEEPIRSTTQSEVELQAERIFCISRAQALPLQFEDLERTEADVEAGEGARVSLDTRLDNRVIDLRTKANQAILRVQSGVSMLFREFLIQKGLVEIHTPKLLGAASEGGADVFKVQYFERNAYLAQSPQLYKQMALMTDLPGVFEIGPVFRAEKSLTFRHMTEFVGLDMEMRFADNYHEVLDVIDGTFDHIFHGLNERFSSELEAIRA
ncbi:aspartate--tRNA ligase, putative, partial [Perkinsus marinus ATCC 50983]